MGIREISQAEQRIVRLAAGAGVWCVIVAGQLINLQVIQHDDYLEQANHQQVQIVEVQAPRGSISDRNGQPLALSVKVESVFVNPRHVPDLEVAAELLSRILSLDRQTLLERLSMKVETGRNNEKALRGFVWVKRKLSLEETEQLRSLKLDWIGFQTESQRLYPKGDLGRPVIGTVDHAEDGNAGAELALNSELKGKNGTARVLNDVRGYSIDSIETEKPHPGVSLTLAVDERIQFAAERDLRAAVEKHHADGGTIVVMKPDTGDLLAMASYNRQDPKSVVNLAVTSPFEPGSVFKVFTIASALEARAIRPGTVFPCGVLRMFGRVLHEAKHAHEPLNVADILAKSSNVGAAQIGLHLGKEKLYEGIRDFGFGARTGVPLTAESSGLLRAESRWNPDTILSVPMGHEISTTTLQLAQGCSVIANGGVLVKPRLILAKQRPDGTIDKIPVARTERVLAPQHAIEMRQMMEGVVVKGTGKGAKLDGYSSGGKTGSAQIYDYKLRRYTHTYNASFMGFAPVTNPAIVVVVTINGTSGGSAGYGGAVAAPVFKTVAQEALRVLEIPKDVPEVEEPEPEKIDELEIVDVTAPLEPEPGDPGPVETASAAGAPSETVYGPKVPNFYGKSVRSVMEEAAALGLPVVLDGKGRARLQAPAAGSVLPPGQSVRVQFVR